MIYITSISNAKRGEYDATYAIVRSMKNPSAWITQMPELSPEWNLFKKYLELRDDGNWNKKSFREIYVPEFIKSIKNNPAAVSWLNELYRLDQKEGKNICLVCFCKDETLCHRIIIAGLLRGIGCNVKTDTKNDYSVYYEMYKAA